MKNTDIQSTINHTSALLVQARNFFEASHFDESERCASEVIALLENETERDDLGDEHDTSSLKYAVLGSLAHAYNRLNTISFSKGDGR